MRKNRRPLFPATVTKSSRRGSQIVQAEATSDSDSSVSKGSERGVDTGRVWRAFRVPAAHRDTTAVLGGAYPFLTGAPANQGSYVGRDVVTGAPFCFDPWRLYAQQTVSNTNVAIIGNIGWGKTNTAMAIAVRGIATGRRVLVPGDPKNDWVRLAEALGGQAIRLGPGMPDRLNPLDVAQPPNGFDLAAWRHQSDQRRAALLVAIVETLAPSLAPLHPEARETLTDAIDTACRGTVSPTLHHLVASLADNPASAAGPIRAALAQLCTGPLAGMLDQPATAAPDPAASIIAVGTADVADNDLAHTLAVLTATSQLDAIPNAAQHKYVIYDEAWRILAAPAHLARVNAELRLSRARGSSTILITHALSDADKANDVGTSAAATARGLVSMCDTRIIFRQAPGEIDRTTNDLNLTEPEHDALISLGKGEALWKTGNTTHHVHTDLSSAEARVFNTDRAISTGVNDRDRTGPAHVANDATVGPLR